MSKVRIEETRLALRRVRQRRPLTFLQSDLPLHLLLLCKLPTKHTERLVLLVSEFPRRLSLDDERHVSVVFRLFLEEVRLIRESWEDTGFKESRREELVRSWYSRKVGEAERGSHLLFPLNDSSPLKVVSPSLERGRSWRRMVESAALRLTVLQKERKTETFKSVRARERRTDGKKGRLTSLVRRKEQKERK